MGRQDWETETLVVARTGGGFDEEPVPIQSVQAVREKKQNGIGIGEAGDPMFTLTGRDRHAIAFAQNQRDEVRQAVAFGAQNSARQGASASASASVTPTLDESKVPGIATAMRVRRLTPTECERLQGFPDDYTLINYRGKPAKDGPRYRALGNSMAVNVMRWIGDRIAAAPDRE